MLGHSPGKLRFMRVFAFALHSVPLIATVFALVLVVSPASNLNTKFSIWNFKTITWPSLLSVYIHIEVLFLIHFLSHYIKLQGRQAAPILSKSDRERVWTRILAFPDVKQFFLGWFYWTKSQRRLTEDEFDCIQKDNISDWLAWAMFSVPSYDPLNIDQFKEVEDILLQLESLNIKFKPGRNMTISATMLNHNPVKAYPKPFLFYVVMKAFECVEFWALTCFGFDKLAIGEITYWVRNSPNKTSVLKNTHHVPIVFIHGLGVGLLQYIHFVYCLKSSQSSRTIFLVELPYVSMRFVEHVPSVEETVAGIEGLLEFHGFQKAHIVGHSWGTAVVSWMIKYSKYTVSSVLLDPIVFLPITPDLAFNFVHRRPGHNTDTVRANEFIVHWLLSRELHISHVISRHYCWHHNLLWPDELPKYHHVVGSSQDMLINGQMLAKYLETNHVEHTMFDVDHGSFLIMPDIQSDIIALIGRVCDAADPEVSP